ncbi:MAG: carbohydrate kinase [Ardenticatenaceae bacterium]|nr:carbohydrate kinase [Ardenticatenaceae bacterium]
MNLDLLCVGVACYDLTFAVEQHPLPDAKSYASALVSCGGGLAANAAVTAVRLGSRTALLTQLGSDLFGDSHLQELVEAGVLTDFVYRYEGATKLSVILAKPDGTRSLIHYAGDIRPLPAHTLDFTQLHPKAILVDGHELAIAQPLCQWARAQGIPTVLDADSAKPGAVALASEVDYLVCSQNFAQEFTGETEMEKALERLTAVRPTGVGTPTVVITLGAEGVLWHHAGENGRFPAYPVTVVDSTGAGDAFHGAFAAALAQGQSWPHILRLASATAALCCTKIGARIGIPTKAEVEQFIGRLETRD